MATPTKLTKPTNQPNPNRPTQPPPARQPDGWFTRIFNAHVPLVASRSGHQLVLLDRQYPLPGAREKEARRRDMSPAAARRQDGGGGDAAGNGSSRGGGGGNDFFDRIGSNTSLSSLNSNGSGGGGGEGNGAARNGGGGSGSSANARSNSAAGNQQQGGGSASAGGSSGFLAAMQQGSGRGRRSGKNGDGLDGRLVPLLVLMAHPRAPFLAGLAKFRNRIRVANIKWVFNILALLFVFLAQTSKPSHPSV